MRSTSEQSSTNQSATCRTIVHQMGKTEVCGQPQNIIALGPYVLELLLSLGEQPAGFADHISLHQGDYNNPTAQIPYLGARITTQPVNVGLAYSPAFESLLRVQPDLILATELNAAQYQQLSDVAPTLVLKNFDPQANLRTVAMAIDRSEQAEQLIATTEQSFAAAKQSFAPIVAAHPRVLALTSSDAQEFYLATAFNSQCGAAIEKLGFQLVYPPGLSESDLRVPAPVSLEILPQLMNEADFILLLGFNWNLPNQLDTSEQFQQSQLNPLKQRWQENPIAQSSEAAQSGRVYFIPAYLCLGLPGAIGTDLYLNELKQQLLSSP
ncbi:ABC transporter substrate-binding protein [Thermocoleostomius sinensis]|uniref:Iron-siderophore ABC transporter substrate-binding protein n=1 Tax=Thermocoleostomius sinensis A174 TaxID=2016057 RepID=A0A9E9CC73_9CYAN|nr:iron-siderophore ABC transporter substrate-binding protein [Thermocoleostomius sinensis]WAL62180.1 iron-siderophore ABC transporter substrate-binding protein [Thermocoleostomius sinensis A174]